MNPLTAARASLRQLEIERLTRLLDTLEDRRDVMERNYATVTAEIAKTKRALEAAREGCRR